MNTKPILLATLDYPPRFGGIAEYLSNIVEHFPEGEMIVLAPEDEAAHEIDMRVRAPIYRRRLLFSRFRPRWLPAWYWLRRLCREQKPALLVVSHLLPMGSIARGLRRSFGVPYAVIVHGLDAALAMTGGRRKRSEAGRVLRGAALIVANSSYTAGLIEAFGISRDRVFILPPSPSFPLDAAPDVAAIKAARRRYKLGDDYTVLTVSRLVRRKDILTVIDAVDILTRRGDKLRYLIVGDGPERAALEKYARDLNLEDRIVFAGAANKSDLPAVYAACDLFVLTPKSIGADVEGFGTVYLEANLMGKPVIGSRAGGIPDAVLHERTGLLVNSGDARELAAAIERFKKNPDWAKRLGETGRLRVRTEFGWRTHAARFRSAVKRAAGIRP